MPFPCRLIENPERNEHGNVDLAKREVGDMWYLFIGHYTPEDLAERHLTAYYFAHNAHRAPLVVLLPGRNYFLIDGQCFNSERGYYDAWTVAGDPPRITVSPSINIVGRYHGFLTDGVLSDG